MNRSNWNSNTRLRDGFGRFCSKMLRRNNKQYYVTSHTIKIDRPSARVISSIGILIMMCGLVDIIVGRAMIMTKRYEEDLLISTALDTWNGVVRSSFIWSCHAYSIKRLTFVELNHRKEHNLVAASSRLPKSCRDRGCDTSPVHPLPSHQAWMAAWLTWIPKAPSYSLQVIFHREGHLISVTVQQTNV